MDREKDVKDAMKRIGLYRGEKELQPDVTLCGVGQLTFETHIFAALCISDAIEAAASS